MKAVELFKLKAHLTEKGFMEILSIYVAIVKGTSNRVIMEHFTILVAYPRQEYLLLIGDKDIKLEKWWISGYLTLYCNFQLAVLSEGWKLEIYQKLRHVFSFSREISEIYIIKKISEHLGANLFIRKNENRVDVNISNLDSCIYLIRFLDLYPLQSNKNDEYLIWREFVQRAYFINQSKYRSRNLDINIPDF